MRPIAAFKVDQGTATRSEGISFESKSGAIDACCLIDGLPLYKIRCMLNFVIALVLDTAFQSLDVGAC